MSALVSAEGRKEVTAEFGGIAPFPQALAEYMSLSGPWSEDSGEFSGINGYEISLDSP